MKSLVQRVLEQGGFECRSHPYNPRRTGARDCLGVTLDSTNLGKIIRLLVFHGSSELAEELGDVRIATVWLGFIVYFPTLQYVSTPSDTLDELFDGETTEVIDITRVPSE